MQQTQRQQFDALMDQAKFKNPSGDVLLEAATLRKLLGVAEQMKLRLLGIDGFDVKSGSPVPNDNWIYDATGDKWAKDPAQVYKGASMFLDKAKGVALFSPTFGK